MTIANGPWTAPEPKTPTAADLRAAINAALRVKRVQLQLWTTKKQLIQERSYIRRIMPRAKASADLTLYRAALDAETKSKAALDAVNQSLHESGSHLLALLGRLDGHLSPHQAGALLCVHHKHIERSEGLVHAATADPTPEFILTPVLMALIRQMSGDPIVHRDMTERLNALLGTDLPLPARPKPTLARS